MTASGTSATAYVKAAILMSLAVSDSSCRAVMWNGPHSSRFGAGCIAQGKDKNTHPMPLSDSPNRKPVTYFVT